MPGPANSFQANPTAALMPIRTTDVGVATVSGTAFGHLGEGYIRFSYASSLENIQEALRRVRTLLQPA